MTDVDLTKYAESCDDLAKRIQQTIEDWFLIPPCLRSAGSDNNANIKGKMKYGYSYGYQENNQGQHHDEAKTNQSR
jgi:hypothetical protein